MNFMSGEASNGFTRQFVDSNVVVYAFDKSAGTKREKAQELLSLLWQSGEGCLSLQVLQEFYVTATRKLEQPLTSGEAGLIVSALSEWTVYEPRRADILTAIDIHRRHRISYWDGLIIQSAQALGCQRLWSEDLTSGRKFEGVEVRNPFAD